MYLTYLYLKRNLFSLKRIIKDKAFFFFIKEVLDCIISDITKKLDRMDVHLIEWFVEKGYLKRG
jgi:hypothetical protein